MSNFIDPGPSNGSDDRTAILAAVAAAANNAGIVDGRGRTYQIAGTMRADNLSDVTIQNCKFVQNASARMDDYRMLFVTDGNRWTVRRCVFDVGSSSKGGWGGMNDAAGIWISAGVGHRVTECEFYGYGKLTAIHLVLCRRSWVQNNYVHDLIYTDTTVNNDTLQGIGLSYCAFVHVSDNKIQKLSGNGTNKYNFTDPEFRDTTHTRGISVSGSNHCIMENNMIALVGQGIDISGDQGNWFHQNIGNKYDRMSLFAEKWANCAVLCSSTGALVNRVGYAGLVCSGPGAALSSSKSSTLVSTNPDLVAPIEQTKNITISNATVYRAGHGGGSFGQRAGVMILQGSTTDSLKPRGIRASNTVAIDEGGRMTHAAYSDSVTASGNPNNEFNTQGYGWSSTKSAGWHNMFP